LLERAAKSKSPRKGRKGRETHEPLEILMPKRPSARGGD